MSQLMVNSAVGAGSEVMFGDGSVAYVSAAGVLTVPDDQVSFMLNAGWDFSATDPGTQSSATSQATSVATSAGLGDSLSRSAATSGGLADSQSRSIALSAGARASMAFSLASS